MRWDEICVVTGTRAEYGLLYELIVTGMHLSPEFGLTYKEFMMIGKIPVAHLHGA